VSGVLACCLVLGSHYDLVLGSQDGSGFNHFK